MPLERFAAYYLVICPELERTVWYYYERPQVHHIYGHAICLTPVMTVSSSRALKAASLKFLRIPNSVLPSLSRGAPLVVFRGGSLACLVVAP